MDLVSNHIRRLETKSFNSKLSGVGREGGGGGGGLRFEGRN